jgi:hypothetical protein
MQRHHDAERCPDKAQVGAFSAGTDKPVARHPYIQVIPCESESSGRGKSAKDMAQSIGMNGFGLRCHPEAVMLL